MTWSTRDTYLMATGNRTPVIRATTDRLAVNYPYLIETGIIDPRTGRKVVGKPIGTCGKNGYGGTHYHTPVQFYKAGLAQNTNEKVFGEVGERKSSGTKGDIVVDCELGQCVILTDIKGEYSPIAEVVTGSKVLRFGTDKSLHLNMMEPTLQKQTLYKLQQAMSLNVLAPSRAVPALTPAEMDALWYGAEDARKDRDGPVLTDLIDAITNPTDELVKHVMGNRPSNSEAQWGSIVNDYHREVNALRSALLRLDSGSLSGPFTGRTTPGLLDVVPLLVLNLEGASDEEISLALTMFNFFIYDQTEKHTTVKRFERIVHDEFWKLGSYIGVLRSVRELFKLGNSRGISNRIIAHHPSDLYGAGDKELTESLFRDSAFSILYRMDREELEKYQAVLKLKDYEIDIVAEELKPGEALYKVGDLRGLRVQHTITNHPSLIKRVVTREWDRDKTN